MKTLVTGGLGFIGSNLVDLLISDGDEVVVLDNISSDSGKLSNQNPKAKYYLDDVEMIALEMVQEERFDRIFHLAAKNNAEFSPKEPSDYFVTNAWAIMEVLEFARLTKVPIVVHAMKFFSGENSKYKNPFFFAQSTRKEICDFYSKYYGVKSIGANLCGVYGPREPDDEYTGTLLGKFLRHYKSGGDLTVYGTGEQKRDFTHVYDICRGLVALSLVKTDVDCLDLASGDQISVIDLARFISRNDESRIKFLSRDEDHTQIKSPDVNQTFEKIGWKAEKKLFDYITSKLS